MQNLISYTFELHKHFPKRPHLGFIQENKKQIWSF